MQLLGATQHFIIDLDGTIYQTLDVKERAWHATIANDTSVGIEISSPGAAPLGELTTISRWYTEVDVGKKLGEGATEASEQSTLSDEETTHKSKERRRDEGMLAHSDNSRKRIQIRLPEELVGKEAALAGFAGEPMVQKLVEGSVHGQALVQFDFTLEQYEALSGLIAALRTALPKIRLGFPQTANGELLRTALPAEEVLAFAGVMGHFHVQTNKIDPGPAFQWALLMDRMRLYSS